MEEEQKLNYLIEQKQLNQFTWLISVITPVPEKTKFCTMVQAMQKLPEDAIIQAFKEQKDKWFIELEIIKDEIKTDIIKSELTSENLDIKV